MKKEIEESEKLRGTDDEEKGICRYTLRVPIEHRNTLYTIAQALIRGNTVKYTIEGKSD